MDATKTLTKIYDDMTVNSPFLELEKSDPRIAAVVEIYKDQLQIFESAIACIKPADLGALSYANDRANAYIEDFVRDEYPALVPASM